MGCLLIVDDEVLAVEGLKKALWGKVPGIDEILVAYEIAQAQRLFEGRPVDVVLADIEMAQENGLDLLAWVVQHHPETRPIVLTCHSHFAYVQRALRLKSFDYLLKPIPAAELIAVLTRALASPHAEAPGREATLPAPLVSTPPAAGPDTAAWARLLRAGTVDRARYEILSYLRRQPSAVQRDPGFLAPLVLDVQQLVYGQLQTRGIPAHQLLQDERVATFLERASRDPDALALWVDHSLTFLERATLASDQKSTPYGRACDHIAQHIAENLYCDQIAAHVSVSPDYLSQLFKRKTGLSVNQYIIREKMKVAADLLAQTQLPVHHIASGLGYANFSHFSQYFKRSYALCPADYRTLRQKDSPPAITENR